MQLSRERLSSKSCSLLGYGMLLYNNNIWYCFGGHSELIQPWALGENGSCPICSTSFFWWVLICTPQKVGLLCYSWLGCGLFLMGVPAVEGGSRFLRELGVRLLKLVMVLIAFLATIKCSVLLLDRPTFHVTDALLGLEKRSNFHWSL